MQVLLVFDSSRRMANDPKVMHRRIFPTAHKLLLDRCLDPLLRQTRGDVLVIGAGKVDYRALMPNASSVICTDIDASETVDLVADAHDLPIEDSRFDTVVAIEVFEHLKSPSQALNEIARVLKPGGEIVVSIPFMFRVHGDPHDYQRLTSSGLQVLFEKHFDITISPFGNRLHVISDILTTAAKGLAALRILNHALCIGPLSRPSNDCPSGYTLFGSKRVIDIQDQSDNDD